MLRNRLPVLRWLLVLVIVSRSPTVASSDGASIESVSLDQEPLLRDLFPGQKAELLAKFTSCLDSMFKLNQAYEVVFSLKAIYNDFLSNKTNNLTDFETRLLDFCREDLPVAPTSDRFWHPLNAHRFVIFTARDMNPKLHKLIVEDARVRVLLQHLMDGGECWLNEGSIVESMQNLLAIKSFYNLTVDDFAGGNFAGRNAEKGFSTAELMELLLHLNRQFDPQQTAEFGDFLRRKRLDSVRSEMGEQPVRSVYRILGKAYYQMKQFDKAIEVLKEYRASAPSDADMRGVDADLTYISTNQRGLPSDFDLESSQSATSLEKEFGFSVNSADSESVSMLLEARQKLQLYRQLCDPRQVGLGELTDSELQAKVAKLSESPLVICENWRPFNGWYPVRKEILSLEPLIVHYSDVFSNVSLLTDSLLKEAEKRIFEAPKEPDLAENTLNRLTQVRVHSFSRPSLPFDSNITKAVINRVEFVTRLDASLHLQSQEKYIEVQNYGHGIRNRPHMASKPPEVFYNGMAEAILFPTDNVIGGELVYPDIGLKIPTKRSDMIVQYKFLPSYLLDKSIAQPMICPIVFGDKWVARIPLGLFTCSQDQEVMMEPWLPGAALSRRRSTARSWTVLARPVLPPLSGNSTGTSVDELPTAGNSTTNGVEGKNEDRQQEQQERLFDQAGTSANLTANSTSDTADEVESADTDDKDNDQNED